LAAAACTSNDGNNDAGTGPTCTMPGAATTGPADTHCGTMVQIVNPAACNAHGGAGDDGGPGSAVDAGDIGNCGDPAYGPTMFQATGADDDCKYNLTWTSTPICENQPVTFTVTATYRSDGSPVSNANPRPDIVLDCTHPIPNDPKPAEPSPETAPGTYTVGPVAFDKPGRWVVRFHVNETCFDAPASPHGHAAFYVNVP
jgi:hypothetical protein